MNENGSGNAKMKKTSKMIFAGIFMCVMMGGVSESSSLQVYSDRAVYRNLFKNGYIGFTKNLKVKCGITALTLRSRAECKDESVLCAQKREIDRLKKEVDSLKYRLKIIDEIIKNSKVVDVDADKWLSAAAKIGDEKADVRAKLYKLGKELAASVRSFSMKTKSSLPLFVSGQCDGEMEIDIPGEYIVTEIKNEANLLSDNRVRIIEYMSFSNRSGIDIDADEVEIFPRSSKTYFEPMEFEPWIARPAEHSREVVKKTLAYVPEEKMIAVTGRSMPQKPLVAPAFGDIERKATRYYRMNKIVLPASGETINVKISDYESDMKCEKVAYTYKDEKVYDRCGFTPKTAIENDSWTIKRNGHYISDNAAGGYDKGRYVFIAGVDREIEISRNKLIDKDRSSGLFGGDIKKVDGYEITLRNLSKNQKKLTIYDRIPVSVSDRIKVDLVNVFGCKGVKPDKDGRLKIDIRLKPGEEKKIKVIFSLQYEKKLEVYY